MKYAVSAVSDRKLPSPDPAYEVFEEPRLPAEELEKEIGDSETWDEASEDEDTR